VIEPRIIQTSDQMRSSRPRSGDAHAQLAGEFGVSRSHERRHLFMANLDEPDLVFPQPLQTTEQSVDAVARIAKDAANAPLMQSHPKEIGDVLCHVCLAWVK
jgi:hypothetical protein